MWFITRWMKKLYWLMVAPQQTGIIRQVMGRKGKVLSMSIIIRMVNRKEILFGNCRDLMLHMDFIPGMEVSRTREDPTAVVGKVMIIHGILLMLRMLLPNVTMNIIQKWEH